MQTDESANALENKPLIVISRGKPDFPYENPKYSFVANGILQDAQK